MSTELKKIRNIALLGHGGNGKTTLAESILSIAGMTDRMGKVVDGNTVSDFDDLEKLNQRSIYATPVYAEFLGKKVNILDAPGSDDFIGGAYAGFRVCENGILVMNAQQGVEVGTRNALRYAEQYKLPLVVAVNHLDGEKADWDLTQHALKEALGSKYLEIQFPTATGVEFNGFIDVLTMKKYSWKPEGGMPIVEEIPADLLDKAQEMRATLVEAAAENDEALMEKFFEDENLSEDEMREGIRKGLASRGLYPIFCVCAGKDMGVRRLMEFLGNVVPFVTDMPKVKNTRGQEVAPDSKAPTAIYFFKTGLEPHIGEVTYFKVMRGTVKPGDDLNNTDRGSKERIGQIFACAGATRIPVDELKAGDIGCTIKLKDVKINHTLTTPKNTDDAVEEIVFPTPIYTVAVKAANSNDDEKVGAALKDLVTYDRSLTLENSRELRQVILGCQGELHLNTVKWYFENQYKLAVNFTAPNIPYRETITKSAEAMYRHKKQSGGSGQFGEVHMLIEPYYDGMPNQTKYPIRDTQEYPLEWGGKLVFNNCIVGGSIDARFMPAILKGIMEKMEQGPLTGSYARDIVVNIYDGKMHPVDSNETAFKIAGRTAFREAFKQAAPKIKEPIYDVAVTVPTESQGGVMTDLQGRRAIVMGMDAEGKYTTLKAKAPLAEMNRYCTALSSLTSGRGTFTMSFSSYELVPTDVQQALLKAYEEAASDEE